MAEPIRVLHIGDVHLGVELYGRPLPEKGYGTRTADFLGALDRALALAEEADLILFPGDIYKNCDPNPTIQREFASRIRKVARRVPVAIIPGNHDIPNAFARASSIDIFHVLELEGVYVMRRPEVVPIPTARGEVLVAGLPFMPRSRLVATDDAKGKTIPEVVGMMREKLIEQIGVLAEDVEAERVRRGAATPAVLMAHYTIAGAEFGGYGRGAQLAPELDLPLGAVRNPVFDYVALAHIHQFQTIPKNDFDGQPPVIYPGSIERVDFGEEHEDKVAVLAELARGKATWKTVPLNPRPFVTIRVEADEADPLGSVRAAIEEKQAQLQGAVVRVIYTLAPGHPNLPEREVRQALDGAAYVAGIRREVIRPEHRARHGGLTTQLTPLEALEEYLRTQPRLEPLKPHLLERAKPLIEKVTGRREGE
ncbi:MAG: exonuclease SbcCD subunit D [Armatimonadota bacterium]